MKKHIAVGLLVLFLSKIALAACGGCCSHHQGATCTKGVTMCRDGSPLFGKCQAKECNKCETEAPIVSRCDYLKKWKVISKNTEFLMPKGIQQDIETCDVN